MLLEPKQMYAAFQQHFTRLFGTNNGLKYRMHFSTHLGDLPRLSAREAERCERPVTIGETGKTDDGRTWMVSTLRAVY